MKRLLIVANRLPVNVQKVRNDIQYKSSAGGLATGLDSLTTDYQKIWIGWPGIITNDNEIKNRIEVKLQQDDIYPLFLTQKEIRLYYEGFSNKTVWPLFHYFSENTEYNKEYWRAYKRVNIKFCKKVMEVAKDNDVIWVQDYHLMMLPNMLRNNLPHAKIGFFLHIPFPSYEIYRTLPYRKDILEGLLGADLIGFHTFEYMRHFFSAVYRIIGLEPNLGTFNVNDRAVQVDAFPMGIDYNKYYEASKVEAVEKQIETFRNQYRNKKMILGVDRLDYSKGIINRVRAFDKFLQRNPEFKEKVTFLMVVVPSRINVDQYKQLQEDLDEAVGHINGKYSTLNWTPIHYFFRSIPFEQLSALYNIADIAFVTPLRDGMNLVAKEYVASRTNQDGVLILSEMAGSSVELEGAISINPNDIDDMLISLEMAIEMTPEEQKSRMETMQAQLKKQTIQKWANDFIENLDNMSDIKREVQKKKITDEVKENIVHEFARAEKKLLLLDYDGTLIPFADEPMKATPDEALMSLLGYLIEIENCTVIIISGRNYETLNDWFSDLDKIELIAEHGTWFREQNEWKRPEKIDDSWKDEIHAIMQDFVDKTPGSFIEEKHFSLVWHYRKTDVWIGDLRAQELMNSLILLCTKQNLEIMDGNKVVEVKPSLVNKGFAVARWLEREEYDFILAIGDDRTDEDLFNMLPDHAYSIKVGDKETLAKYRISSYREVRKLLHSIAFASAENDMSKAQL